MALVTLTLPNASAVRVIATRAAPPTSLVQYNAQTGVFADAGEAEIPVEFDFSGVMSVDSGEYISAFTSIGEASLVSGPGGSISVLQVLLPTPAQGRRSMLTCFIETSFTQEFSVTIVILVLNKFILGRSLVGGPAVLGD